jgi:hypothetical protein
MPCMERKDFSNQKMRQRQISIRQRTTPGADLGNVDRISITVNLILMARTPLIAAFLVLRFRIPDIVWDYGF